MSSSNQFSSVSLLSQEIFRQGFGDTSRMEYTSLSYLRAKALSRHYSLTIEDILSCSPKFWRLHMDGIAALDCASFALLTIQVNLVAGTVAPFALENLGLQSLVKKMLNFKVTTAFMLNELGHGNDARNLETTATLQDDGCFILHSPRKLSWKFMPPSIPIINTPRVAVVFARLIVDGEDRGVRPFVVPINDGQQMCKGVKSHLLPPVACGRMLDHSLTSFDHVVLPSSALLGDLAMPANFRDSFLATIGRIGVGTMAVGLSVIPLMKCAAYIVGKYSQQRIVQLGLDGKQAPIISFRTQQIPILHTLAQITVLEAFAEWAIKEFQNVELDPRSRHGIAVIIKATFLHHAQPSVANLVERSGAQGIYLHNQMTEIEAAIRIVGIAEGDIMVLCIRLATELLIGRYNMPRSTQAECLLAQHEAGVIAELQELQEKSTEMQGHRSEDYNSHILPHCRGMIVAIGLRMAYEAALNAGVDPDLLALYESAAIKTDFSWYVEHLGLKRSTQLGLERKSLDAVLPQLDMLLDNLNIEPYCTAPMLSPSRWQVLMADIPTFSGYAEWDPIGDERYRARASL